MEEKLDTTQIDDSPLAGKYLLLNCSGQIFGIPIGHIQEIVTPTRITRVPESNESLLGVMNLRGRILPLIDLSVILGRGNSIPGLLTCYIVVNSRSVIEGEELGAAILVDGVREVVFIEGDKIQQRAELEDDETNAPLLGIASFENTMAFLLDLDTLLGSLVVKRPGLVLHS